MEKHDIRWIQRLHNLECAVASLSVALAIENPDIVQRAGMIQFFEMSMELAWETLKDYLQYQGSVNIQTPRTVLKEAFAVGLLEDGHQWLKGLEDRNLTSYTYNEQTAQEVESLIRETYYSLLEKLIAKMDTLL